MFGRVMLISVILMSLLVYLPGNSHGQALIINVNGISDDGIYPNGTTYSYYTTGIMGYASVNNITTNVSVISFTLAGNFVINISNMNLDFLYLESAIYNESNGTIHVVDYIYDDSYQNASMMRPEPPLFPMIMGQGIEPDLKYYYYSSPTYIYVGNQFNISLKIEEIYKNEHASILFSYSINGLTRILDNPYYVGAVMEGYFVVNGSSTNPIGYPYDIEFVIGNANPFNNSMISYENGNVLMNLEYYNGYNYQSVENAVNYGSILPDVLNNASESEYVSPNGMLYGLIQPGTGVSGYIYSINNVSIINATMPSLTGIFLVNNSAYPISYYNNGYLILTVGPGNYTIVAKDHIDGSVLIGNMGYEVLGNATINATPGSIINVQIGNMYEVIFNYMNAPKEFIGTEIKNVENNRAVYIPPFEPVKVTNFTRYTFLENGSYEFIITYGNNKITGNFELYGNIIEIYVNLKTGEYTIQNLQ
ncbi:MAG: thermopsin family protease [Thermoplasmata archaeon]